MNMTAIISTSLLVIAMTVTAKAEEMKLTATDGKPIWGTFTAAKPNNDKIVILFHQARSNRHEYDPVVPVINKAGYDTLRIDQRSGGTMWGKENQTVKAAGRSTEYVEAYPDLQAAVDWAVSKKYKNIITVGSSYSAALNFHLAKRNSDHITAIACFSPGEYLGRDWSVAKAAIGLKIPVYVTSGSQSDELQRLDDIVNHANIQHLTRHRAKMGVHGASTLRKDRNPGGYQENLAHFMKFLESL